MNSGPWKCPTCGEEIEAQFDACWNCSEGQSSMIPHDKCLHCGGDRITMGGGASGFSPDGLKSFIFVFTNTVPTLQPSWACLDCGLVWSAVYPERLTSLITEQGKQATKERFGL
jgi:hypothetical protein